MAEDEKIVEGAVKYFTTAVSLPNQTKSFEEVEKVWSIEGWEMRNMIKVTNKKKHFSNET